MAEFQPISPATHASRRWLRPAGYSFASSQVLVPIGAAEISMTCLAMPIAIIREGEQHVPVAMMGLQPNQNLLVGADGRWLGAYIPAVLRGYPFCLAQTETGSILLCVEKDSVLPPESLYGEEFYTSEGEPAELIKEVAALQNGIAQGRSQAAQACNALADCGVLQPWEIVVEGPEGKQQVSDLLRVDEGAMLALSDEKFGKLRASGAIAMAYAQLLSIHHLQPLAAMASSHGQRHMVTPVAAAADSLDLSKLFGDTLKFN